MKILLVEDQKNMAYAIEHVLNKHKFIVDIANDGIEALEFINICEYDVIVLDVMLPKLDGFSVLKKLRESKNMTPVIMLTAKSELDDKLEGLNNGADDYLLKPFEMLELIARIECVTRRKGVITQNIMSYNNIMFNKDTLELSCNNKTYILTAKESLLLELFITKPDTIISKDTIINKIWSTDKVVIDNNVEVYISFIRKKIESLDTLVKIKTVRGIGYKMVLDV